MTTTRIAAAAFLAAALPVLAACGGSDSSDPGDASSEASSTPSESPDPTPTEPAESDCRAEVEITGAIESSWTSGASVTTSKKSGPTAFYQTSQGDVIVSIYAAGNGFDDATFVVQQGGTSYGGTLDDDAGAEVAADGSGASIDVDAQDATGEVAAHVTASITC